MLGSGIHRGRLALVSECSLVVVVVIVTSTGNLLAPGKRNLILVIFAILQVHDIRENKTLPLNPLLLKDVLPDLLLRQGKSHHTAPPVQFKRANEHVFPAVGGKLDGQTAWVNLNPHDNVVDTVLAYQRREEWITGGCRKGELGTSPLGDEAGDLSLADEAGDRVLGDEAERLAAVFLATVKCASRFLGFFSTVPLTWLIPLFLKTVCIEGSWGGARDGEGDEEWYGEGEGS